MNGKTILLRVRCVRAGPFHGFSKPINVVFMLANDLGITDIAAYATHFSGKHAKDLYYELPQQRDRLMNQLRSWLGNNVALHYLPIRNSTYRGEEDRRLYPFMDLTGDLQLWEAPR